LLDDSRLPAADCRLGWKFYKSIRLASASKRTVLLLVFGCFVAGLHALKILAAETTIFLLNRNPPGSLQKILFSLFKIINMEIKSSYRLTEVNDKKGIREFLAFPSRLYKNDKNWIRPLDQDIEAIFDASKNKNFRHGDAVRWLLKNKENKTVGRVAAFYNEKTARKDIQPTGGLGFFDCIDDQKAANLLFDACRDWLRDKGMEAMDGPVNFGERDSFWGCLVDGFIEPIYNMPYNFPYYQALFEDYGFKNYFNQYTYGRDISTDGVDEVIWEKAERIARNPDYTFKTISWKNNDQFAEDFMIIFNKAWAHFSGVKKISKTHALGLLKKMRPIMDTRLVHYAYYQNEPIAFFIMMPDLYQIIRKFNGKFHWLNKLRFVLNLRYRKTCSRIIGRIFGVVPEFQGKGLEAGLIKAFEKIASKPGFQYNELQMNWIGDFNPAMIKVVEQIGARVFKRHVTYRFLFDRSKPFTRAKAVN
jgi:GNAT superfamily N-acetyltransferase